jgi:hypothetical protein
MYFRESSPLSEVPLQYLPAIDGCLQQCTMSCMYRTHTQYASKDVKTMGDMTYMEAKYVCMYTVDCVYMESSYLSVASTTFGSTHTYEICLAGRRIKDLIYS